MAGGGASVIYSDTICDLGGGSELANYGEYSGAPSESQTFEYAKTLLSLMTKGKHPDGEREKGRGDREEEGEEGEGGGGGGGEGGGGLCFLS